MFNPLFGAESFMDWVSKASTKINDYNAKMLHNYFDMFTLGASDIVKSIGLRHVLRHKLIGGGLIPLITNMLDIEKQESEKFLEILKGESKENFLEYTKNITDKFMSGIRYDFLVKKLGKELFGSAKFEGEEIIDENEFFKLSYIPKKGGGARKGIIFHVGGVLPFSDKIFRFLPETNYFDRFLEAGLDIYAMELKGNAKTNQAIKKLTFEKMVESVHHFTDKAYEHNGKNRMIIEGYCGLGIQTITSVLADAKAMEKKIAEIMLMVAPIDGRVCNELGNIMNLFPKSMVFFNILFSTLNDEVVKGDNLRRTIDIAQKSFFEKTSIGRFIHGWKSGSFSKIKGIEDLDKYARRDLAGTYWISPDNAGLYPVPVSLSHLSTMLFTVGVSENGVVPVKYKGKLLNFNDLKETDIKVVAFYGDSDALVPTHTADVLEKVLGNQFVHVTHAKTGHVSYILSPKRWDESNDKAFKPGVISTILNNFPKKQKSVQNTKSDNLVKETVKK